MVGIDFASVAAYFAALIAMLLLGLLLFRLFKVPMKLISKLFFSSLIGGFALFGLNWLLSFIGYSIPVNIFNAVFVGFLGVPGLITVIILSFIL